MTRRNLNKRTAPNPLRDYGKAIKALAEENAAALERTLPDGPDDIQLLGSLCEDVHAYNNAWLDLVSACRVARAQCEDAARGASGVYEQTLVHMQLVARKLKGQDTSTAQEL